MLYAYWCNPWVLGAAFWLAYNPPQGLWGYDWRPAGVPSLGG